MTGKGIFCDLEAQVSAPGFSPESSLSRSTWSGEMRLQVERGLLGSPLPESVILALSSYRDGTLGMGRAGHRRGTDSICSTKRAAELCHEFLSRILGKLLKCLGSEQFIALSLVQGSLQMRQTL